MSTLREAFLEEVEGLLGTPYVHQGRNPALGVDCAGLVIVALSRRGWTPVRRETVELLDYRRIPEGTMLRDYVLQECDPVPRDEAIPGDLALFAFGPDPQHLAILVPTPKGLQGEYIIHAVNRRGVTKHRFATEWKRDVIGFYRIRNIDSPVSPHGDE